MRQVDAIATTLLVVGALNWGLVGFAHFDLVAALFGIAGLYRAVAWKGVPARTAPLATR